MDVEAELFSSRQQLSFFARLGYPQRLQIRGQYLKARTDAHSTWSLVSDLG
jgi:hypothetical protein